MREHPRVMEGALQDHNMLYVLEKHNFLKRLINCTWTLQKIAVLKKKKKEKHVIKFFFISIETCAKMFGL
jgi:hypothetical protein